MIWGTLDTGGKGSGARAASAPPSLSLSRVTACCSIKQLKQAVWRKKITPCSTCFTSKSLCPLSVLGSRGFPSSYWGGREAADVNDNTEERSASPSFCYSLTGRRLWNLFKSIHLTFFKMQTLQTINLNCQLYFNFYFVRCEAWSRLCANAVCLKGLSSFSSVHQSRIDSKSNQTLKNNIWSNWCWYIDSILATLRWITFCNLIGWLRRIQRGNNPFVWDIQE